MPITPGLPGHWKCDAAEVLSQGPDYVLLGNVDVTAELHAGPGGPGGRPDFPGLPPRFEAEIQYGWR